MAFFHTNWGLPWWKKGSDATLRSELFLHKKHEEPVMKEYILMSKECYLHKIRKAFERRKTTQRRLLSFLHERTRHLEKATLPSKEFLTWRIRVGGCEKPLATKTKQNKEKNTKKKHGGDGFLYETRVVFCFFVSFCVRWRNPLRKNTHPSLI